MFMATRRYDMVRVTWVVVGALELQIFFYVWYSVRMYYDYYMFFCESVICYISTLFCVFAIVCCAISPLLCVCANVCCAVLRLLCVCVPMCVVLYYDSCVCATMWVVVYIESCVRLGQ